MQDIAKTKYFQYKDKSVSKSLVGLEDDVESGALVWLDAALSNQDDNYVQVEAAIAAVETD